MTTTGNTTGFDRDDGEGLRDPALRRALDHAPDSNATPDARTRDAILKMAHNMAAVPAATRPAANSASAAPWWRRVFGGGGEPRSRMPWNAAFATVLVATFVTVLWHREPVPDAQLDGEARVGGAAAPAQAPAAPPLAPAPAAEPAPPSADAVPPAELPAAASAAAAAAAAPAAPEPAPPAAATAARRAQVEDQKKQQQVKAPRDSSSAKEAAGAASADAVRRAAPPPQPAPQAASPAPIVPAPAVAAAPPPAIVAEQAAPASPREERVESERRRAYADESPPSASAPAAAPAPAPAPAPAYAPPPPAAITAPAPAAVAPPQIAAAPPYQESKSRQSALADQAGNANADVSGALRSPAPRAAAAAKPARSQQGPASFSALDRWTSFSFTGSGGEVRHARGDIEGLPALVGTVARSAVSADEPLAAPVDARLSLYRGGTLIAVLEIAGAQVRWTPQPGGAALVGTPPAQTLDALRSLLTR